jgi:hypothetical protein
VAIPVEIAVAIAIPTMVMLNPSAITFPEA